MEPNSYTLIAVLLVLVAAALFALIRLRHWLVRSIAGVLVVAMSAVTGMAAVNDYYGYYQTWSQLAADFSGSYSSFATTVADRTVTSMGHGVLETVQFPGARSGINRAGLVYLPPQYFQKRFAHTRFPVIELLHGTPGSPSQYVVQLDVVHLMDRLITAHALGPMILVMPTMSVGHNFQECVNAPGALDDTYVTTDVRTDVLAHFRASSDPAQWGVAGFSSGGYCAANLALRHRSSFGAAGIMDGYFRPQDGPAAAALNHNPSAEAANNPILEAAALQRTVSPLPAFWLSAGSGVAVDLKGARAFIRALHGVEQVPMSVEPGAGHNFYAWAAALPHLLTWMWTQLASPDLRVAFPVAGPPRQGVLVAQHPIRHLVLADGAHAPHGATHLTRHGASRNRGASISTGTGQTTGHTTGQTTGTPLTKALTR